MDMKWIRMCHMATVLLVLLWKPRESLQQESEGDHHELTSSACFYEQKESLTLSCSPGQMVRLTRIFYGHSARLDRCEYDPEDCVMDLPTEEMYPCIGMSECRINLPTGSTGKRIPKCQLFATYAQANYQCVPASQVVDICDPNVKSLTGSQSGYIATPRYPNNYPDDRNCSVRVTAPYGGQRLKLYIIELVLETNDTDCADWLHLFDGHRGATYCSTRARSEPLYQMDRTVEVTFHSNRQNRMKGFWLYYEAYPYMETTAAVPVTMTSPQKVTSAPSNGRHDDHHPPNLQAGTTTAMLPSTVHKRPGEQRTTTLISSAPYDDTALTIGAVLGVVISIVLVITVIILVILFCKRKDRSPNTKVLSSNSCNSEAAFLQISNNCYAQSTAPGGGSATSHHAPYPPLSPTDYVNSCNAVSTTPTVGGCYPLSVGDSYTGYDIGGVESGRKIPNETLDYRSSKAYPTEDNDIV